MSIEQRQKRAQELLDKVRGENEFNAMIGSSGRAPVATAYLFQAVEFLLMSEIDPRRAAHSVNPLTNFGSSGGGK